MTKRKEGIYTAGSLGLLKKSVTAVGCAFVHVFFFFLFFFLQNVGQRVDIGLTIRKVKVSGARSEGVGGDAAANVNP